MAHALGIDIGGTGIKGARVDVDTGELLTDRLKLNTPKGGEPDAIVATVLQLIEQLGGLEDGVPVGICFPSMVKKGHTLNAWNISPKWVGLDALGLFTTALNRQIAFLNDADAAGFAEAKHGAAKGVDGLVILTTLGTGIGTALIHDGELLPHAELGHVQINGKDAEQQASYSAKERDDLDWKRWVKRLQPYYEQLETIFFPDLFVVGGGVSKNADDFLPLLEIKTSIVPAVHRNSAGVIGAAAKAADQFLLKKQR